MAALGIERIRTAVAALVWTGLVLGLLFTMSNVAAFAARGAAAWSVPWVIAWLLDPMVSLCLIGVLIAESTLSRYQLEAGQWVRGAKWGLLAATYVMNTWSAWAAWDASLIVLHSVPPGVVFVMAEAVTDLRSRLTDAVLAAHRFATRAQHEVTAPQLGPDPAPRRVVPVADRAATHDGTEVDPTSATAADRHPEPADQPTGPADRGADHARRVADRTVTGTADTAGPDVSDLLDAGRQVRDRLTAAGLKVTRRALIAGLREDGHAVSTDRAGALRRALSADITPTPTQTTQTTGSAGSGATAASEAA
ncbi:MAG: hypothetical protein GEV07_30120 [Streptosporangiales bacterium]|nr:hypothetical protein [Streptosporangiales bacterium]